MKMKIDIDTVDQPLPFNITIEMKFEGFASMQILKFFVLLTLFGALFANQITIYPEDDLATMDWGRTANGTIPPFPFTWDRDRFLLLPNSEGQLELTDRNQVYQIRLESQSYDASQDVRFLFFSSASGSPVELSIDQVRNLTDYGFRKDLPSKILIHDWLGGSEFRVMEPLAKEYLKKGEVNVIGVIWTKGSGTINYPVAAYRVPKVAELIARAVDDLLVLGQIVAQIGLIGHGLGAHVAGLAGRKTRQKVAFIVGLDPVQFMFNLAIPEGRLTPEDAQYVEVIHTNGQGLGFFTNIGAVDFYPNGGKSQPGCAGSWICSHGRAVAYFIESLATRGIFANRCASLEKLHSKCSLEWVEFGEETCKPPPGVYYLETNSKAPFLKTASEEIPPHQGVTNIPQGSVEIPEQDSPNLPYSVVLSVRRKVSLKKGLKYKYLVN